MALKNLLLHLDGTRACDAREDAAIALAASHDAHLTGLFCIGELHFEGWAEWPMDLIEEQADQQVSLAEKVGERFRKKAERAGIGHEMRTARVPVHALGERLALHTRYADLAILGQVDPDELPIGGAALVEQVLLGSGRPVLVIPYIGAPGQGSGEGPAFGRDVALAWDGGREATRAANDALPIMERAERVCVLVVDPRHWGSHHGDEPGSDIARHLARHGVTVDVDALEAGSVSVADSLLARVSDGFNDLLVMGGYGHSRLREIVLGGVTRRVLEQMTVPVLLSH